MKLNKTTSVMEVEVASIEESMLWIVSKGIRDVCIESNSLLVVQAINGITVFHLEVGHSIDLCMSILAVRSDWAAHYMTRIPCVVNSFVNVMNPLQNVLDSVMYDAHFE